MKGKIAFSIFMGVVFALLTFVLTLILVPPSMAVLLALLALGLGSLMMHIALVSEERRNQKRFASVERDMKISFYHKANGNFIWGKVLVNGNIYFGEHGLCIVSVEKRPYLIVEIHNGEISRCDFDEMHIHLYLEDGKELHVLTPDAQRTVEALRAHGWQV